MVSISAYLLKSLSLNPGPAGVQFYLVRAFAIDCGSADMQLCVVISLKSCGLLKIMQMWTCGYAVAEQNFIKKLPT
jgi:hypothetical protein